MRTVAALLVALAVAGCGVRSQREPEILRSPPPPPTATPTATEQPTPTVTPSSSGSPRPTD